MTKPKHNITTEELDKIESFYYLCTDEGNEYPDDWPAVCCWAFDKVDELCAALREKHKECDSLSENLLISNKAAVDLEKENARFREALRYLYQAGYWVRTAKTEGFAKDDRVGWELAKQALAVVNKEANNAEA